ncbi:MAG: arabinogalactan endo-1,4-beta-galactosidase [Bacteroidales bacterium]|nr:arabinogalactan endo-1,4-beta-galactosidase [Bacteroidales bacterium]MCF8404577.1 arabinogalactan endo-1,4-beta-galactosidase [Bacteroidales bacterium]
MTKYILRKILPALFVVLLFGCKENKEPTNYPPLPQPSEPSYFRGMDLSFQPEIEDWGTQYFDENGSEIELLPYFSQLGVNLVRLRIWHTPATQYNGLESVVAYAKKVKANNMEILLDFHYSDTWADPGKQFIPAAWEGLSLSQLNDSVYEYTHNVMQRFKNESVFPSIVQIGNETNSGFLWDLGKVGGDFETNWPNYTMLVKSAAKAIRELDEKNETRIMLHFAGLNGTTWFFDNIIQQGVDFDVIGLSFYTLWHGTDLSVMQADLNEIAQKYTKEIMIVETGYPWTLEWNDYTNNFFGSGEHLAVGYPASPDGQKLFLEKLDEMIKALGEKGIGFCYWAPEWVAFKGPEAADGSVWENVTVFDFDNKVLPAIKVFAK